MQNKPLLNKIAIVIIGTNEIGKAVSTQLARAGAIVIILGKNVEKGNKIVSIIRVEGDFAEFYHTDLINKNEIEKNIKQALAKYKKVDILVSIADVPDFISSADTSISEAENISNIIFNVIFQLSELILPKMIENKYGRIIHVSSITPRVAPLNSSAFNINKIPIKAIHALTRRPSIKMKPNDITFNAITPILILSESIIMTKLAGMIKESSISPRELLQKFQGGAGIDCLGGENAVAEMVMFLVSTASRDINGQIFNVAGDFFANNFKNYLHKNEKTITEIDERISKLFLNLFRIFHISLDIFKKKIRRKTCRF